MLPCLSYRGAIPRLLVGAPRRDRQDIPKYGGEMNVKEKFGKYDGRLFP